MTFLSSVCPNLKRCRPLRYDGADIIALMTNYYIGTMGPQSRGYGQ